MLPDDLVAAHFRAMETGDRRLAEQCIHPDHVNFMAADEPPACSKPGVPGFLATSAWLRSAFTELHFEVVDLLSDEVTSIAHTLMRGRQSGPFVVYPPGSAAVAFPPSGRAFEVRHCHVFTVEDGRHISHRAVRDDLGMMTQLGHLPPTPRVALRMMRFAVSGASRRAVRTATTLADTASTLE